MIGIISKSVQHRRSIGSRQSLPVQRSGGIAFGCHGVNVSLEWGGI